MMKKKITTCLLFLSFTLFVPTQQALAMEVTASTESEQTAETVNSTAEEAETVSETEVPTVAVVTGPVNSTASIGFSTKEASVIDPGVTPGGTDGNSIKPAGRLPSTGELVGGGIFALGLLCLILLVLYWMKEQKNKLKESY